MKSSLGSDSSCRVRVTSSCNLRKEIRSDQGMLSGKRSMESPQDMVWDTEKVKVAPAAHITWLRAGLLSFSPAMARTKRTPAHSARLSHLTDLLSCRVNVGHTSPDCPTVAHMSWHTLHPAPCIPGLESWLSSRFTRIAWQGPWAGNKNKRLMALGTRSICFPVARQLAHPFSPLGHVLVPFSAL